MIVGGLDMPCSAFIILIGQVSRLSGANTTADVLVVLQTKCHTSPTQNDGQHILRQGNTQIGLNHMPTPST